jgi:hypothetical protein
MDLVQTIHVRRINDLNAVADTIAALLDADTGLVDLSRYDQRADVIQLRAAASTDRTDT